MEDDVLFGRTQSQAPEIDGVVYLSETEVLPGKFVEVTITDAAEYDLVGIGSTSCHGGTETRRKSRAKGTRIKSGI
jgi:hypothetical protein